MPLISGLYSSTRNKKCLSVFPGSVASGNVSDRVRIGSLGATNGPSEVETSNKNRYRPNAPTRTPEDGQPCPKRKSFRLGGGTTSCNVFLLGLPRLPKSRDGGRDLSIPAGRAQISSDLGGFGWDGNSGSFQGPRYKKHYLKSLSAKRPHWAGSP